MHGAALLAKTEKKTAPWKRIINFLVHIVSGKAIISLITGTACMEDYFFCRCSPFYFQIPPVSRRPKKKKNKTTKCSVTLMNFQLRRRHARKSFYTYNTQTLLVVKG